MQRRAGATNGIRSGGTRGRQRGRTLPQLLAVAVESNPGGIALAWPSGSLTYAALDARSNQLARLLIADGVGPEDVVAVALPRSPDAIIAIWAVAKAGAAYLPVDPHDAAVVADSGAVLGLSLSSYADALPNVVGWRYLDDLELRAAFGAQSSDPVTYADRVRPLRLQHPAYVVYPAGSAGVVVTHAGLAALCAEQRVRLALESRSRVLVFARPAADAVTLELLMAVSAASTLVLAPNAVLGGAALGEVIRAASVTHLFATPAVLASLDPTGLETLEVVATGDCAPELVADWARPLPDGTTRRFHRCYGSTEVTVVANISAALMAGGEVNVGAPLADVVEYVLDERLARVPDGAVGELYVGGPGVARSYRFESALTAACFVADPFGAGRMYRTGELVRRVDGALELVGESASAVSFAAPGVEPVEMGVGPVERRELTDAPEVHSRELPVPDHADSVRRLTAVPELVEVTVADAAALSVDGGESAPAVTGFSPELDVHELPAAPDRFARVVADSPAPTTRELAVAPGLPIAAHADSSASGVDDSAVVSDSAADLAEFGVRGPAGSLESRGIGGVSSLADHISSARSDDAEPGEGRVGASSTLGSRELGDVPEVASRTADFPESVVTAPESIVSERPDIAGGALPESPSAPRSFDATSPRERPSVIPLSAAQQRLWALNQGDLEGDAEIIPFALRLRGSFDPRALHAAVADLVARHESLRTHYPVGGDGVAHQVVLADAAPDVFLDDLDEDDVPLWLAEFAATGFNVAEEVPLRVALATLSPTDHVLAIAVHRIAADGASVAPLLRDLVGAYLARRNRSRPMLRPLPAQYADHLLRHAASLGSEDEPNSVAAQQASYWTAELADLPALLDLATDRPDASTGTGAEFAFSIPAPLRAGVAKLAVQSDASEFMVMHAALAVLLSQLAATDDVVIGTFVTGRDAGLDDLVGPVANTVVLRTRIDGHASFADVLTDIRRTDLAAFANADLPFERVMELVAPERTCLCQVALSFEPVALPTLRLPGLEVTPVDFVTKPARFDLHLTVEPASLGDPMPASITYATPLFDAPSIENLTAQFMGVLAGATSDPTTSVADLVPLPAIEREEVAPPTTIGSSPTPSPTIELISDADAPEVARIDTPATLVPGPNPTAALPASKEPAELTELPELATPALQVASSGPVTGEPASTRVAVPLQIKAADVAGDDPNVTPGRELRAGLTEAPGLAHVTPTERGNLAKAAPLGEPVAPGSGEQGAIKVLPAQGANEADAAGDAPNPADDRESRAGLTAARELPAVTPTGPADAAVVAPQGEPDTSELGEVASTNAALPQRVMQDLVKQDRVVGDALISAPGCESRAGVTEATELPAATPSGLVDTATAAPQDEPVASVSGEPDSANLTAAQGTKAVDVADHPTAGSDPRRIGLTGGGERVGRVGINPLRLNADDDVAGAGATGNADTAVGELAAGVQAASNLADVSAQVAAPGAGSGPRIESAAAPDEVEVASSDDVAGAPHFPVPPRPANLPLSPAQRRVWFLNRFGLDSARAAAYNRPLALRLSGDVDADALAAALRDVIARHEILRTIYPDSASGPHQMILPADEVNLDVSVHRAADHEVFEHVTSLATTGFDVTADVPLRVQLIEVIDAQSDASPGDNVEETTESDEAASTSREYVLAIVVHHIAADAASMAPLLHDLTTAYAARTAGNAPGWADLPLQYADYALGQADLLRASSGEHSRALPDGAAAHSQPGAPVSDGDDGASAPPLRSRRDLAADPVARELLSSWREQASKLPAAIELPTDRPRPPVASLAGGRVGVRINAATHAALARIATEADATLFTTLHTAFAILLARLSGSDDITVGTSVPGRDSREFLSRPVASDHAGASARPGRLDPTGPAGSSGHAGASARPGRLDPTGLADSSGHAGVTARLGSHDAADHTSSSDRLGATGHVGASARPGSSLDTSSDTSGRADTFGPARTFRYPDSSGRIGTPSAADTSGRASANRELQNLIGLFENPIVLRTTYDGGTTFTNLLGAQCKSNQRAVEANIPFAHLIETINPPRSTAHHPLFQVGLSLQSDTQPARELPGLTITPVQADLAVSHLDLHLVVADTYADDGSPQGIEGFLTFATDLFDARTVTTFATRFGLLLEAIVAAPNRPVGDIDLRTDAERLTEVTAGAADLTTSAGTLADIAADADPDAIAIVEDTADGRIDLTYAEFNAKANRLARHLISMGVGPESLVAVALPRSADLLIAMLAVARAGGAYVPIDPDEPAARTDYLLHTAAPICVLTKGFRTEAAPLLRVDHPVLNSASAAPITDRDRRKPLRPDNTAYVFFTSGSTGRPKGVAVAHAAIVNQLQWFRGEFGTDTTDAILLKTPATFDRSPWELWSGSVCGGRTVIARPDGHRDPAYLATLIAETGVTTLAAVPSLLDALATVWDNARPQRGAPARVLAEDLTPALATRLRALLPDARIDNLYGPTEAVVSITDHRCTPDDSTFTPIGKPEWNSRVYVLDERLRPVPPGIRGELYLAGVQLARGYLRRAALTAERFVADPFDPAGRMYRTGDLGSRDADGTLKYLGRNDFRVSVHGARVEPGEVEAALTALPGVEQAAVVARADAHTGVRLVAYLVGSVDVAKISDALRTTLPAYLVPDAFVVVDALPRTVNGTIDRADLPAPTFATATFRAPETPTEQLVADVFAEVLGAKTVGADDDFFALGGNSMLATRAVARIGTALDRPIGVRLLFEAPTVAELAHRVSHLDEPAQTPLQAPTRPDRLPLTAAQQRNWLLNRIDPTATVDNVPLALRLTGQLDTDALAAAIDDLFTRHEVLRTCYPDDGSGTVQSIRPPARPSLTAVQVAEDALSAEIRRTVATSFDVTAAPPVRVKLLRLSQEDHVLVLVVHRISVDSFSMGPLVRDLVEAYTARAARRAPSWTNLPLQYADYAVLQQDSSDETQLNYWTTQLAGLPAELPLPLDRPRPRVASNSAATVRFTIETALSESLADLARTHNATVFMVVQTALAVLLARLTGTDDIPIGTPVAGRAHRELDDLVGPFVNTLVLRSRVTPDAHFADLLAAIRETDLAAFAHANIPFERLIEMFAQTRSERHPDGFAQTGSDRHIDGLAPDRSGRRSDGFAHAGADRRVDGLAQTRSERPADGFAQTDSDRHPDSLAPTQSDRHAEAPAPTRSGHHIDTPTRSDRITSAGAPTRSSAHPLVQVALAFDNSAARSFTLPGLEVTSIDARTAATRLDLSLTIREHSSQLDGEFTYATELFDEPTVARFADQLIRILTQAVADPTVSAGAIELMSPDELSQVTLAGPPAEPARTLADLMDAAVSANPTGVAVRGDGRDFTYTDLNKAANQLARALVTRGAGPEVGVAVAMRRSVESVLAVWAIARTGATIVPIDPGYPAERISHMLDDSGVAFGITMTAELADLPTLPGTVGWVALDNAVFTAEVAGHATVALREIELLGTPRPDNAAYLTYTSSSTGMPKGVLVSHRGLVNLQAEQVARLKLDSSSRPLAFASPPFDASLIELLLAIGSTGTLVVAPAASVGGTELARLIRDEQVTHAFLTPAVLSTLDPNGVPGLRAVCIGGEDVPAELAARWNTLPNRRIHDSYGPTEATIVATMSDALLPGEPVLMGGPIRGMRALVLDQRLRPVAPGVVGELYLGGPGLARGYHRSAGLTAGRFLADPFGEPGERLYRTGDLVRRRGDALEFAGRNDFQVKVRGLRVELGEVDTALASAPGVTWVTTVSRENASGASTLIAYVVGDAVDATSLTAHASRVLPDYMVPTAIIVLDAIPVNAAGKLALPEPTSARTYRAPQTEPERIVARVVGAVLGHDEVGIDDDFFALGGDSVTALEVVARAAASGARLRPRDLFDTSTIGALADRVELPTKAEPTQLIPLTATASALLDADQAAVSPRAVVLDVPAHCSADSVAEAAAAVMRQHPMLWVRLDRTGETPVLRIPSQGERTGTAFRRLDTADGEASLPIDDIVAAATAALDPDEGRNIHFLLTGAEGVADATLGDRVGSRLVVVANALVLDDLSLRAVIDQLAATWSRGRHAAPSTPDAGMDELVRGLAAYPASAAARAERQYWHRAVRPRTAEAPDLRQRGRVSLSITGEGSAAVAAVAEAYRATIDEVLLTAAALALHGGIEAGTARTLGTVARLWADQRVFGGEESGAVVGGFTTDYPLALRLDGIDVADALVGGPAAGAALGQVKEARRAVPMGGAGFGLLRQQHSDGVRTLDRGRFAVRFRDLRPAKVHTDALTDDLVLVITVDATDDGLHARFDYATSALTGDAVRHFAEGWIRALGGLAEHGLRPGAGGFTPSDFPLVRLTQGELTRLMRTYPSLSDLWPATPLQSGMLFHALLAESSVDPYLTQAVLDLEPGVDPDQVRRAAASVVERHDNLRVAFASDTAGTPVQVVVDDVELPWRTVEADDSDFAKIRETDLATHFDMAVAPLVRFTLVCTPTAARLLVTSHRIVLDERSLALLGQDLLAAHGLNGRTRRMPKPAPYRDYLEWLAAQDLDAARQAWRGALAGLTEPTPLAPVDLGREIVAGTGEVGFELSTDDTAALIALADGLGVTVNTVVNAAWGVLIARLVDRDDVVFGATVSGRPAALPGADRMVGLFLNTVPVRVRVRLGDSVADLLTTLHAEQVALRDHQVLGLGEIQDIAGIDPLFDSLVAFGASQTDDAVSTTHYPLTVRVTTDGQLRVSVQYLRDVFDEDAANAVAQRLSMLLARFVAAPTTPIGAIDVLLAEERASLASFNATGAPELLGGATLLTLFDAQVARTPDAIAFVDGKTRTHPVSVPGATSGAGVDSFAPTSGATTLTYAEFDARVRTVAAGLVEHGAVPEALVAVAIQRGIDLAIAIYAVLRTGAAYLPLDPDQPAEHTERVLAAAGAVCVLTTAATGFSTGSAVPVVDLAACAGDPATDFAAATPDNLAYVIPTSGSTGMPKSVMLTHRQLVAQFRWAQRAYPLSRTDVVAHKTSVAFDIAAWELLWPLQTGASVVIAEPGGHRDPAYLGRLINDNGVTVIHFVPSMLDAFFAEHPTREFPSLRRVFAAGETLSGKTARLSHSGELVNWYGPAETTVATAASASGTGEVTVAIGKPVANMRVHILDRHLRPVPPGTAGELYIEGVQLARGYLGAPARTAERFVAAKGGTRLYRTGDLVALTGNTLMFLDRTGFQVRLRGQRIEPAAVEAVLTAHPDVCAAAVTLVHGPSGDRLVGYVVPSSESVDETGILAKARTELPAYMAPSALVVLPALPLTASGKLDRHALPSPAFATRPYRPPTTAVQRAVAEVFAEVLGVGKVGLDDDFFELGGNSLVTTKAIARLRMRVGVHVRVQWFFTDATVAALAERIDVTQAGAADYDLESDDALNIVLPIRNRVPHGEQAADPLFCLHPAYGLSWCYAGIAQYVPSKRPIFGLQSPALSEAGYLPGTLAAMAGRYVTEIKAVQPEGPYRLMGWSLGGVLAHAVATRLQAAGDEVALLAMLDSHPDTDVPDFHSALRDALAELGVDLGAALPTGGLRELSDDALAALHAIIPANMAVLTPERVRRIYRSAVRSAELIAEHTPDRFKGRLEYFSALGHDAAKWAPYVDGEIIDRPTGVVHDQMTSARAFAEIGPILGELLNKTDR
ncbi:hypothetical protein GCM10011591_32830 [Nocardia camponoti]|uniref:Carrier domain-containing protein n=1 Tax=Nocardia camponoti TaxID=1616106 RepID=A0A917QNC5_9NOCA|nr:hypothetical protein GCM10011591_32830 [Nocardia camponoti]